MRVTERDKSNICIRLVFHFCLCFSTCLFHLKSLYDQCMINVEPDKMSQNPVELSPVTPAMENEPFREKTCHLGFEVVQGL